MPPKGVRRPAAAPRPRGILHRPAAAVGRLRRRAGHPAPPPEAPDLGAIPPRDWLGKSVRIFKGKYWDEEVCFAGRVSGLETSDGETYLNLEVEGTTNENLLKYLSGIPDRQIYGHLCGRDCKALIWRDGLCHVTEVQEIEGVKEAWTTNLKGGATEGVPRDDELAGLRREAALVSEKDPLERGRRRDRGDELPERERDKRPRSAEGSKKKRKKRKIKCRPKKDLAQTFGSTGLDPDPVVRKRLLRKAQRIAVKGYKKEKTRNSSSEDSDSSSSSSSSGAQAGQGRDRLFLEELKVHQVAERFPGTLTAGWIQTCQDYLTTSQGQVWDVTKERLPPLAVQYFRSHVQSKLPGVSERSQCAGSSTTSTGSRGSGPAIPKTESFGVYGQRCALQRRPEDGVAAVRTSYDSNFCRDQRGRSPCKGGRESDAESSPRRISQLRGRHRKRKLWKGSWKGQGQERGQERQRRKGSRAERRPEERFGQIDGKTPAVEGAREVEERAFAPQTAGDALAERLRLTSEADERREKACKGGALKALDERSMKNAGLGEAKGGVINEDLPTNSSFAALGKEVLRHLQRELHCMSKSTAGGLLDGDTVNFPPAGDPSKSFSPGAWEDAVLLALQSLAGEETPDTSSVNSIFSRRLAKSVRVQLQRFDMWEEPVAAFNFEEFFMTKTIDYRGEQVKLGQALNWVAVESSLPDGVGCLKLEDFCTLGTKHYVQNFEAYLMDTSDMKPIKKPKVMVSEAAWEELSEGLVRKGLCEVLPVSQLFHVGGSPLLNGMFAVGKGEFIDHIETQRLIMNLVPLNGLCAGLEGDVGTLPSLSTMGAFLLDEGEVCLVSSEDIRCFFYLHEVPREWRRFMGFNKLVPTNLIPSKWKGQDCVLVSRVLPMGFVNSVSIAQHIHRNVTRWASVAQGTSGGGESEIRKDKGFPVGKSLYRVYLDNFDQLEVVDRSTASLIAGTPSAQVLGLRLAYQELGLPRHPKKAVTRQMRAEVQGAVILGDSGIAIPKPAGVVQYVTLALELLKAGVCTLRELQVVCGGLVYMALFRRPLLCGLNKVWEFMEEFKRHPVVVRLPLPAFVRVELARMVSLVPLAQMNFANQLQAEVTCSDASQVGGGICVSKGLTGYGVSAANSEVRGTIPEEHDFIQVLTVGLFDGIGALRVACDLLGVPSGGHISIEKDPEARRVLEAHFADTVFWEDVTTVTETEVKQWALKFSNCGLVLIGAGPPCQGVSKLNADRRGALRDHRSCLFAEVERITDLFRKAFPWAQIQRLMESVASMGDEDRVVMSLSAGGAPWLVDSAGIALCHRPRLYWITWDLLEGQGVMLTPPTEGDDLYKPGKVTLEAMVHQAGLLEKGCSLAGERLPTFTTSRPRDSAGRRPAGLESCQAHERQRWAEDRFRYPPYQYRDHNGIISSQGLWRSPTLGEREVIMGFPRDYTAPSWPKNQRTLAGYLDKRASLIGNSWHVGVVAWLLGQLLGPLGLGSSPSPQQVVQLLTLGRNTRITSMYWKCGQSSPQWNGWWKRSSFVMLSSCILQIAWSVCTPWVGGEVPAGSCGGL